MNSEINDKISKLYNFMKYKSMKIMGIFYFVKERGFLHEKISVKKKLSMN